MRQDFLARALSADNLPTLPQVAIEVLALSKDPDASADDLAAVVQNDPVITARLLKIVNSALFGVPRKVSSIRQAVSMLGLRSVTVTVLTFALVEGLRAAPPRGMDSEAYWRSSISSAVAARLLARALDKSIAEDAFIVGLLSNIGIMAAFQASPDEYAPIVELAHRQRLPLHELEQSSLGVDHAAISAALLRLWGLPESTCAAVAAHHSGAPESSDPAAARLASLARHAATISALFCGELPPSHLTLAKAACVADLAIDASDLERALTQLNPAFLETSRALALDVGATIDYHQLQADAAQRLASLSIEAEAQRTLAQRNEQAARSDAARLQAENRAILEVASTDGLTGIANRSAFDHRIAELLTQTRKATLPLALLFMDVDRFKLFNDTHGHQAGDEALRVVAATLKSQTVHEGFVARYGGEEFVVLLAGKGHREVRALADSLRAAVARAPIHFGAQRYSVTISVGVAYADRWPDTTNPEHIIQQADERLYHAKQTGRNRVEMALFAPAAAA